jgi:hypothetical protein
MLFGDRTFSIIGLFNRDRLFMLWCSV